MLNRSLPLSFYASDSGAKASAYNLVLEKLSRRSPRLHRHLTGGGAADNGEGGSGAGLDLDPDTYLAPVFTALFTRHAWLDECTRLWDVYVFERDAVLGTAAVALLLDREMALLAAAGPDDVRRALAPPAASASSPAAAERQGKEDEWIARIRAVATA